MSTWFEAARAATELIRTMPVDGCDHPAEAIEHAPILNAFRCSMCLTVVTDEAVAQYMADLA